MASQLGQWCLFDGLFSFLTKHFWRAVPYRPVRGLLKLAFVPSDAGNLTNVLLFYHIPAVDSGEIWLHTSVLLVPDLQKI